MLLRLSTIVCSTKTGKSWIIDAFNTCNHPTLVTIATNIKWDKTKIFKSTPNSYILFGVYRTTVCISLVKMSYNM